MKRVESNRQPARRSTVWLARHSEVHNPEEIYYGRLPRMGLSVEGCRQAEALADFFGSRSLVAVYSSPLLRARKVAYAIKARHPSIPLRIDRDLNEVRTCWQGCGHAMLDGIGWEIYSEHRGPEDETMEAILTRMRCWVSRIRRRHSGGEVLGITHGDPMLILLAGLRGLPLNGLVTLKQAAGLGSYAPVATVARISLDSAGDAREIAILVPPYEQSIRLACPTVEHNE